jgi:hypothetical protein
MLAAVLACLCGVAAFPAEEPIAVGVYFNTNKQYCPADPPAFEELKALTGREAKLYMNFQSWNEQYNTFAVRLAENARSHGGIYMVVWMPGGEAQAQDPAWSCAAIAKGARDEYIRQYAQDVRKYGRPIMIRFAHEMNGHWYPWGTAFRSPGVRNNSNTPADYVAMWRHVWGIFKEAGVTDVHWVWAPNIFFLNTANSEEQQRADFAALYPGDEYVDWIGLDGYNDGVKSKWRTFPDLFDAPYRAITGLTQKPLMIAEFGSSEKGAPAGTSKAAWITQTYMKDIPEKYPRVRLVNWFHRDKSAYGETDWRFNSSPEALAAYAAAVNAPLYQGEIKLGRAARTGDGQRQ